MPNLVTSPENSQGVIFKEKSPVSSSDFNELQTVFNNRSQALANNISIGFTYTSSEVLLTSINLKNKIVTSMEGISIVLPKLLNNLYIFTRSILILSADTSIYKYGLRSNTQFKITGKEICKT